MPISSINGEKIQAFVAPVEYVYDQSCNLDDLTTSGIYTIQYVSTETKHQSFPDGSGSIAIVIVANNPAKSIVYQHFISIRNARTFDRTKASGVWSEWSFRDALDTPSDYVYDQTADLDTFTNDGVYRFRKVSTSGDISSTFPNKKSCYGTLFVVTTDDSSPAIMQTFISVENAGVYVRYKTTGNFSDWWSNSGTQAPTEYVINQSANLDEITTEGTYTFQTQNESTVPMHESFPTANGIATMLVTKNKARNVVYQSLIESDTGKLFSRYKLSSGWKNWHTDSQKQIRILFVGNSLTQDGIAYVPWLIRHFFPSISFKFYIWYNGGKTLTQQYQYFLNNEPCDTFSVAENSSSWTNRSSSVTMSEILSTYEFDIVCMQEYYNSSEQPLQAWNDCKDYIRSNYCDKYKKLEFISLFHAPKRNDPDTIYQRTKEGNASILKECIADDMIPNGMAVYRALSTDLDSLGDQGHLSPDGLHTQEGLPCLLQSWVTILWILDRLGMDKSIYGTTWKMSSSVYSSIKVPGPNLGSGVIAGTDSQNILAQEVAIKAFKEGKKFVNNNLWAD